jgi:RNA polymerase sigma-70 factor (ECF subfamily)
MLYNIGMNSSNDATDFIPLIELAKNGDKNAFGELYAALYTPLFRFVMSRSRDHEKTVDICQEVFVRWYKSLDTYEMKIKPLSYLMMIATRLMINDTQKKKSVMMPEDAEEFIADESESFDSILNTQIDFDRIKEKFTELSVEQQIVIEMKYISDLDNKTIAEALEKTEVAVRQLESRALKKLRDLCRDDVLNIGNMKD